MIDIIREAFGRLLVVSHGVWLAAAYLVISGAPHAMAASETPPPALVVLITVDQLRGDMPYRHADRFGPGGFRYLMERGVYYKNAHYRHLSTFTAPAHAVIATGRYTGEHGIAGNGWYDGADRIYCVQSPSGEGVSPENLLTATIGDDLVEASGGAARVFSVSIKDRGAIIPGGKRGKAFWYDRHGGRFITNPAYYYPDGVPAWVERWNRPARGAGSTRADDYRSLEWRPKFEASSYAAYCPPGSADCIDYYPYSEQVFFDDAGRVKRGFPYAPRNGEFYSTLRLTPFGDRLTLDFVRELLREEKLGAGEATDLLAISFSASDYVGHAFGPDSVEYEDNLLRLDETLAQLFRLLDERVGLDRVLIVLTSDHGTDSIPRVKQRRGLPAGKFHTGSLKALANGVLQDRFGVTDELVAGFSVPGLFLNTETLDRLGLDRVVVQNELAEAMRSHPGIARAVTRATLTSLAGREVADPMLRKTLRSFHAQRSGDVILIQKHSWFLNTTGHSAAMHGSPYEYDTHVPIMAAGPAIEPAVVHRRVAPVRIAATIAHYLGIAERSGRTADPILPEIVGSRDD